MNGDVDLAKLIALLPPNTLPLENVTGRLALKGQVTRSAPDALPDITLDAKTTGLRIAAQQTPDVVRRGVVLVAQPAWDASGVDVHVLAEVYGARGAAKVAVRLADRHGALVAANASSDAIPFRDLMASGAGLVDRLMRVPLTVQVVVPARPLDEMPAAVRVDGVSGTAEARMSIEGTALSPKVEVHAKARTVKFEGSKKLAPLEADLDATYDGARAGMTMIVRDAEHERLHAAAQMNAKVEDLLHGGATAPWTASASGTLVGFPLEAVPTLSDRRLHGTLDGEFDVTDLHKDARAKVALGATGLRVGKQKYGGGRVDVTFDGRALAAEGRLEQEGGFANVSAKVPLRWGASLAPSIDPDGSIRASLTAKKFRIGFLAPFVQSVVESLDGTIDANAQVSLDPNKKPEVSGSVSLSDGVVGVTAIGQEMHGVKGRLVLTQQGVVRLEEAEARGIVGKLTASGTARLDGTALVGAELDAQITERDAIPIDAQGTDVGAVYGKFKVNVTTSADRKAMNVAVDIPSVHVQLPETSTHSVQELSEPPSKNHVGVFTSPDRFTALPLDGHEAAPQAHTGAPANTLTVGIKIDEAELARGTDLRVDLAGNLTAKLEQKTAVTGQIQLRGGKLDVRGKSFEIENGTVTFTGEPANPEVKVTAGWSAEDGTRVYADYVGPLKTGRVTLRSEPGRPQNEIVALILFGTADGSEATPYSTPPPDVGTKAGTTVGGFATGGLSEGLDKLTGLDITAKIDTSQANPRPEVEVQIARDISLQLAFVLGTPPPGTNPDTTYATIDWRFHRSWSLETTFGNLGSSIADVVWRRRY